MLFLVVSEIRGGVLKVYAKKVQQQNLRQPQLRLLRYVGRPNDSRSLSLFGWLLNKKAVRVEVNISLAFLHWVEIALHP